MSCWPKGSWPSGYLPDSSWCPSEKDRFVNKAGHQRRLGPKSESCVRIPQTRLGWERKLGCSAVGLNVINDFPLHKLICCWAGLRYVHSRAVLCLISMRISWGTCQKMQIPAMPQASSDCCGVFWLCILHELPGIRGCECRPRQWEEGWWTLLKKSSYLPWGLY